jgi:hypothetical protein
MMRLQTIRELLRDSTLNSTEGRTTTTPSHLTCQWEQDTWGKLACFWTLQPKEEGSVHTKGTREMPRPR